MKNSKHDYVTISGYAMILKNLRTGEFMVFPDAIRFTERTDSGYSGAYGVTIYYANVFDTGSGSKGRGMKKPEVPHFGLRLKEVFLSKFADGELQYDTYPKGTKVDKIRNMSEI